MPGIYQADDYDAAGCAIGAVTEADRLPRLDDMRKGDVLLDLASVGVHSNGFSLVHRIIAEAVLIYSYFPCAPGSQCTFGGRLAPHAYAHLRPVPPPQATHNKGLAHITGSSLIKNIPRMLPPSPASIDFSSWDMPAHFR